MNDRWQRLAATLERQADGEASATDVAAARSAAGWEKDDPTWFERLVGVPDWSDWDLGPTPLPLSCPYAAALTYGWYPGYHDSGCKALRELVGNPFRPSWIDRSWLVLDDRTIRNLALAIYGERTFDRLPILADALEDAGCTDSQILDHLRGPGPHVRGCWCVDLCIEKE